MGVWPWGMEHSLRICYVVYNTSCSLCLPNLDKVVCDEMRLSVIRSSYHVEIIGLSTANKNFEPVTVYFLNPTWFLCKIASSENRQLSHYAWPVCGPIRTGVSKDGICQSKNLQPITYIVGGAWQNDWQFAANLDLWLVSRYTPVVLSPPGIVQDIAEGGATGRSHLVEHKVYIPYVDCSTKINATRSSWSSGIGVGLES
jgi:hypothetical protein